jgi:hypothetical protein
VWAGVAQTDLSHPGPHLSYKTLKREKPDTIKINDCVRLLSKYTVIDIRKRRLWYLVRDSNP